MHNSEQQVPQRFCDYNQSIASLPTTEFPRSYKYVSILYDDDYQSCFLLCQIPYRLGCIGGLIYIYPSSINPIWRMDIIGKKLKGFSILAVFIHFFRLLSKSRSGLEVTPRYLDWRLRTYTGRGASEPHETNAGGDWFRTQKTKTDGLAVFVLSSQLYAPYVFEPHGSI